MTKNGTPTPVYLDPGMHPGLEVKGLRVVVSTAAFHARVRGLVCIVGSLCDREVACSASDLQGVNFESCVWRTVSSHSPHLNLACMCTKVA